MPARCIGAFLLSIGSLPAQIPEGHLAVVTRIGGAATSLLSVDPALGAVTTVASTAPATGAPPLAVAVDPVNRDVLLAVDRGATSDIVRWSLTGATVNGEVPVATVIGTVRDLTVASSGDVYAAVEGPTSGIYRIPRRGGVPTLVVPVPRPRQTTFFGLGSTFGGVGSGGDPTSGAPAEYLYVDLATGTPGLRTTYTGFTDDMVGSLELATAVPRVVHTHPDGSITISEFFQNPVPLNLPNFGSGSTGTLLSVDNNLVVTLGGQAHPYVKAVPGGIPQPGVPINWVLLAGPLPGDPVDMALADTSRPSLAFFGEACGASMSTTYQGGNPALSSSFSLGVQTSAGVALVLGFRDDVSAGAPLPFSLPVSGCPLLTEIQSAWLLVPGPQGFASRTFFVPSDPALAGLDAYAQWIELGTFATSTVYILRIG